MWPEERQEAKSCGNRVPAQVSSSSQPGRILLSSGCAACGPRSNSNVTLREPSGNTGFHWLSVSARMCVRRRLSVIALPVMSCSRYGTPDCSPGPSGSCFWIFKQLVTVWHCGSPDPLILPYLGAHLLCRSTRAMGVCCLYIHRPLSGFWFVFFFLPEGMEDREPRGVGGGLLVFSLSLAILLPASPGMFRACLHKVDAGCNSVMNSMNTNLLLPLTSGSLKDQNQTI